MPRSQSLNNHARLDPAFHFTLIPILLLNLVFSIYTTFHHWPVHRNLFLWWIIMSVALLWHAFLTRIYSLKVQDRVIRLEERLRIAALPPSPGLANAHTLTERQLVALRFASDADLPNLVHRSLAENLTPKQIKESITTWRPDFHRV